MPSSLIRFRNFSSLCAVSCNSSIVRVQKTKKTKKTIYKKIVGHPDIFGPHHDCAACGGIGCGHCS